MAICKTVPVLADSGYEAAGCGVITPVKHRTDGIPLHTDQRTYSRLLRGLRCLAERGFALLLDRWKALRHVTMSPRQITTSPVPHSSSCTSNTA